jgi:hypothetical protein
MALCKGYTQIREAFLEKEKEKAKNVIEKWEKMRRLYRKVNARGLEMHERILSPSISHPKRGIISSFPFLTNDCVKPSTGSPF